MNRSTTFFVLVYWLFSISAISQNTDSWINYDRDYFKIKVADDGLYRINAAAMQAAGIPISTIASSRYQMFRRGEEIAIRVNQTNNIVNYIEFYGEKNRGDIDAPLYVSEGAQQHQYYNLNSDSAAYFLTWSLNSQTGKRISFNSNNDASGLSPETYYLKEQLTLQTSNYASGRAFGPENSLTSAKYDFGEGWTGASIGQGAKNTFSFAIADAVVTGPNTALEVVVLGRNNLSHQVDFAIGNDATSLTNIGSLQFSGQSNSVFNKDIDWSVFDISTDLIIDVMATGFPGQSERISVSSVKLTYPANFETISANTTYNLRSASQRLYIRVPTTESSSFEVFDISDARNPVRLAQSNFSNRFEFVVDPNATSKTIYVKRTVNTISELIPVQFEQINFEQINYLILTHAEMRNSVNGVDPINEYQNYRSSPTGGDYNVATIEIQQAYDQYGYGDISPLAIRNMVLQGAKSQLRNVLIIGKGLTVNNDFYRQESSSLSLFVPTFGFPGSDALFAIEAIGDAPVLGVGRLNAISSSQVLAYLNKVKEMDALPFDALWRKDFLQLSGGQTPQELNIFSSYIKDFEQVGESDFLGGRAFNRNKESSAVVEVIDVADRINRGVSLVTFFGHSSSAATDIEIGRVSQAEDGYQNQGKYPVFLVNGCNAGEIFGSTVTFGEDWLLTANLGAVAFVAHSDFALSSALKQYSDLFYQYAFADEENFASTLGELTERVSQSYFSRYGVTQVAQSQVYGMLLQGDPALKVFGGDKPDFDINDDFISFESAQGSNLTANSSSFEIKLNIRNFGKTVKENLNIQVVRTLPDGTIREYAESVNPIIYQDTVRIVITNNTEDQNAGINAFQISLDPENLIDELNEINNVSQVEFFLAEGTAITLYPIRDATVATDIALLKYQNANFLSKIREFDLQIDTSSSFNSPYKRDFVNSGDLLLEQEISIGDLPDSTAVFWRVRYANLETGEDTSWVNDRFSKIKASLSTWSQVSNQQLVNNTIEGLAYNRQLNEWDFTESTRVVEVNTHGTANSLSYEDYRVVIEGLNLMATDNPNDPFCRLNTINAVVFDNQTGAPIRPFGITGPDISNNLVCGVLPQMIHNFTENDLLGANRYLDSLISVVPNGTSFLIFTLDSVSFSNWDDRLAASLSSIGINQSSLSGLIDGQPIVILGKKGMNTGSAQVLFSDGTTIPRKQQALKFVSEVVSKFSQGNMTSDLIGPARSWERFDFNIDEEQQDANGFNILGVDNAGQETVLQSVSRVGDSDLTTINANTFPYLKLRWFVSDYENQTAAQLNGWSVSYQRPPEGVLRSPDISMETLQEGEPFSRQFQYLNVSDVSFEDSIQVVLKMTNLNSGNNIFDTLTYASINPGDTAFIQTDFNTVGQTQESNVLISVSVDEQEQYLINNTISFPKILEVIPDQTNPVLDVTFDGNYILAGDIVSPNPLIEVKVKDENEFLINNDTTAANISLKLPCEGCEFERVLFSSNQLSYTTATAEKEFNVEYRPGPLEDGVYGVRVQAKDKTGNVAGSKPFETTFEVINESSISHFYPYPNPFSTSMRFVFTLTGMELPEAIKVQIMTVSGRVVREISEVEIGSIKIGHNITDFAWDGKDEYGDQLANGVYFYKVFTKRTGEPFKHFDTTADRAFKNGFGKIYLLR